MGRERLSSGCHITNTEKQCLHVQRTEGMKEEGRLVKRKWLSVGVERE